MDNELKTQIREALDDGGLYIKRVQKNLNLITDSIESKNKDLIKKNYADLKEGLEWLFDVTRNIGQLLNIDYSKVLICKQGSDKIINNYSDLIGEIDDVYNKKEYNQLSLLIKEELPKQLKKITSVFNKIKADMNEKEN